MPATARKVMPLLIHGDAAFAGQGVVAEMLRPVGPQGLPHRRHDAFHRQQPDRLHHAPDLRPLLALLHRRRQDDRGADLPRQWRRSRSGGLCRRASRSSSARSSSTRRRHRHVLLPEVRPQRSRTSRPSRSRIMYKRIAKHPAVVEHLWPTPDRGGRAGGCRQQTR